MRFYEAIQCLGIRTFTIETHRNLGQFCNVKKGQWHEKSTNNISIFIWNHKTERKTMPSEKSTRGKQGLEAANTFSPCRTQQSPEWTNSHRNVRKCPAVRVRDRLRNHLNCAFPRTLAWRWEEELGTQQSTHWMTAGRKSKITGDGDHFRSRWGCAIVGGSWSEKRRKTEP